MQDFLNILVLALLGSVIALMGGVVFLLVDKWNQALTKYSVPFAAGVMMTVSLLGLLPEAVDILGELAFLVSLIAFIGSFLFENIFCDLHHHEHCHIHDDEHHRKSSVALVVVGDTIHNFVDGAAIAASYLINPGLGLVTTVSTFLHEVPHEIGDFGILLKAGFSKKKVFWINFFSALSTVLGAILIYFFVKEIAFLGYLLAIASGMFMYLGASDFLPKASKGIDTKKAIIILLLGVSVMYFTLAAVPHSHDHEVTVK